MNYFLTDSQIEQLDKYSYEEKKNIAKKNGYIEFFLGMHYHKVSLDVVSESLGVLTEFNQYSKIAHKLIDESRFEDFTKAQKYFFDFLFYNMLFHPKKTNPD